MFVHSFHDGWQTIVKPSKAKPPPLDVATLGQALTDSTAVLLQSIIWTVLIFLICRRGA